MGEAFPRYDTGEIDMAGNPFTSKAKKAKKTNPFTPKKKGKSSDGKPEQVKAKKGKARKKPAANKPKVNPFTGKALGNPYKAELKKAQTEFDKSCLDYEEAGEIATKKFKKLDKVPRIQRGSDRFHRLKEEHDKAERTYEARYKACMSYMARRNEIRRLMEEYDRTSQDS